MAKKTILAVDDEPTILELVRYNLEREGYVVKTSTSGAEAIREAERIEPDCIILDLMLPGIDGLDVCRRLKQRERTRGIPVLMLTAKSEDSDVVTGLEVGADDYITKPFSPRVLTARVRAALRRKKGEEDEEKGTVIRVHDIRIDGARHEVTSGGETVSLSATEFAILEFLAKNPGWVFTRNKIIDAVKGKDYPVTERSVDVQILSLRKKLGERGILIETVRGVGYRLQAEGR